MVTRQPAYPSRRVVLTGLGATVALPWLESSRGWAGSPDATGPPKRFAMLFFGDGIHPAQWWATGEGRQLELGPAFASLEPLKHKVNFIDGLAHPGNVVGGHARGGAGILTGVAPRGGREIHAAVSLDQVLAQRLGDRTAIPSLALACERPVSGFHESGYSMMYASHVSWSSPVAPVPTELHPSLAFDSLYDVSAGKAAGSVLDYVLDQLGDVSRKVSRDDRAKIDEYASSVREVEQRLQKLAEAEDEKQMEVIAQRRPPDGLPAQIDEHARLMCDVIALAFQTDRTRFATLLLTNNLSGQVYPFLGLRNDHHSFSHGWQKPEYASITRFWVERYAYLLSKLDSMPEGEGTVLDNCCVMMANEQWTAHSAPKIPLLLAGGLGGEIKTGRSLRYEGAKDRRLSSLYLSLLERMGTPLPSFGNSDQALDDF